MNHQRNVVSCHSVFDFKVGDPVGLPEEVVIRILFMLRGERGKIEFVILSRIEDRRLHQRIMKWLKDNLTPNYIIYEMQSHFIHAEFLRKSPANN